LLEQVTAWDTLLIAAKKALKLRRRRSDAAAFYFHLEYELLRLQSELWEGQYSPGSYRAFTIYEPKERQICAAEVRDRVVHHAICHVIEPYLEQRMIYDSYACRPGKGAYAAVTRARRFMRSHPYYLKCDIQKYFASIDHAILKERLSGLFKDRPLLALLGTVIDAPAPGHEPGKGLPIGNLTSQHFANLYLDELDHFVKESLRVKGYVRYMDDFVLFGASKEMLHQQLNSVRNLIRERLELTLKPSSIRIAPVDQGLAFLGFRVFPGSVRLDRRKWARFRRRVRSLEAAFVEGAIDEAELSARVGCMIAHLQHGDTLAARRRFFAGSLSLG
jgi:retron-type reverse transcriptase